MHEKPVDRVGAESPEKRKGWKKNLAICHPHST
jgi:hypothetical protein